MGATFRPNEERKVVNQSVISKYAAAQQSEDLTDEEKIKAAIDAYFTIRYEGQKFLEEQDFSDLLDDDSLEWVKKREGQAGDRTLHRLVV